jgi:hypothetical protein
MAAHNVPTVDDMIALFPHPTLPRVSAEGNYNELVELRNCMKENFCSIYTIRGGGNYGRLGDLLANTMYATIAPNTPYVVSPNAAPQPVIEAGTTLINKENLLRAYNELKRENIEYKTSKAPPRNRWSPSSPVGYSLALNAHIALSKTYESAQCSNIALMNAPSIAT